MTLPASKNLLIPRMVLEEVPARIAAHYSVMPLELRNNILVVGVPPTFSRQTKEELKIVLAKEIETFTLEASEIDFLMNKYYGIGAGVIEALSQSHDLKQEIFDFEVLDGDKKEDVTIIKLVNELLSDAIRCRASDIHIEPFEQLLRIRYRVDGLLRDARISEQVRILAPNILSRVKIMAKLDISEKRLPQDGRIKVKLKNETLDLRVSVLPSSFGEAIVIRILKPLELLEFGDLGFNNASVGIIRNILKKPHGVFLITGPTGSGKTTTLYSCLRELNQTERKIITIEDPIEYKLRGVIQMQVNSKIDFTFAKALRAILRHDPDCIMVGEIRDAETAEIAIRSALTGHLVLSTIHTNDAPSAVTRLVEMGVEPYLVSSALVAVMAQRLVRKCCTNCKKKKNSECELCLGSGFQGRIAISEIMNVTEEIRDLVLDQKTGSAIRKTSIAQGMMGLYDDGISKVREQLTTEEEIQRVCG